MANDFLTTVKPAFDFLSQGRGYHLAHEEVSSSFDNGSLIYESSGLRIHVTRDRGQVSFDVRAKGGFRDYDEEILRLLLAGSKHYARPSSTPDFAVGTLATFLRDRLSEIEHLFEPSLVQETSLNGEALKNERADVLFGKASRA